MEEALRKSEEKYRFVFERSPAANLIISAEGRIRDVTNSFADRLGYSNDEIVGRQALEFVVAGQRETVAAVLEMAFKGQDTPEMDVGVYAKDGSVHTIFFSPGQVLLKEEGQPTSVLFTGVDITERKRVEQTLRENEERYRELADSITDIFFAMDKDLRYTYWNKASENLTGISAKDAIGKSLYEIFPDVKGTKAEEVYLEVLRTGQSTSFINEYKLFGRQFVFEISAYPTRQGIAVFTKDITERKRMEEEIRSLARFPSENPNPVLRLDRHGTVLSANEASKPLLQNWGCEIGQVAPKSWRDPAADALSTKLSRNIDVEFGGRFYTFLVKPTMEGGYVNLYGRDITERKRVEDSLRASELKYRTLFEKIPHGVYQSSPQGMFLTANPALVRMLGYESEAELLALDISHGLYVNPEDREAWIRKLEEEGVVRDAEIVVRRKDGGDLRVLDNAHVIHDEQGRVLFYEGTLTDITELKRLQEELERYSKHLEELVAERSGKLAESEKRFRELAELLPQIVFEIDEKANLTFLNHVAFASTGYSEDDLRRGLNAFQMFAPEDHDRAKQNIGRLLGGEKLGGDEYTVLRKDGGTFPAIVYAACVMHENRAVGLRGIVIDITQRKQMEEELRSARERLDYVITSNPAVILTGKPHSDLKDFDMTYVSRNVASILGYEPKEFTDDPRFWERHTHPEDVPRVLSELPRLFRDGHAAYEYRFLHRDGTYRWILEETKVTRDPAGNPAEVIGYLTDITARKRAEEELRAARERLDYLVKSNPAVIYSGKPLADHSDFVLTYVSERVVSMFGFEPQDFIGHPEFWERHVPPEDKRSVLAEVPRLWREGQHTFEYRFLHKDGSYRWIREEAKVVRDAAGKPVEVIGYWTDITEHKRMEARLAEVRRLAAIGEAAAMVGHDLRNPLQAIITGVYLGRKGYESLPPEYAKVAEEYGLVKWLSLVEGEIEYMDKIVSDLQDYAVPLKPDLSQVNIAQLLKDALSKTQIPSNVNLSVRVEEGLQLMIDPGLMKRVFSNLITNAVQAMPEGGELTVDASKSDEEALVSFHDTGVGIPQEDFSKLFNPFFTTKAKGQGLGLAVCKRLVEAHGGEITVESRLGEDTTFTIRLPHRRL
jgi:PAS domain S-box-containing protein